MSTARIGKVFELAPFIRLLGLRLTDAGDGWVETTLELRPEHLQQHGYVHAGVVTTMADHTAGGAASTVIPVGHSILTAQVSVSYLRPARGAELRCRAEVIKPGRTLVVTQADVQCDGSHVARLQGTMAVVEGDIDG